MLYLKKTKKQLREKGPGYLRRESERQRAERNERFLAEVAKTLVGEELDAKTTASYWGKALLVPMGHEDRALEQFYSVFDKALAIRYAFEQQRGATSSLH